MHIKLDIANQAWSSDLETETTQTYMILELDFVESLELSLNSSDLMSIKIMRQLPAQLGWYLQLTTLGTLHQG